MQNAKTLVRVERETVRQLDKKYIDKNSKIINSRKIYDFFVWKNKIE